MKLIVVFILFLSCLANAEDQADYGFDLGGDVPDALRTEDINTLGMQIPGENSEEADLPHFEATSADSVLYGEANDQAMALTRSQKDVMDIFSTTLNAEDSMSLSISPSGGGTLVKEIDYSGSKGLIDEASIAFDISSE